MVEAIIVFKALIKVVLALRNWFLKINYALQAFLKLFFVKIVFWGNFSARFKKCGHPCLLYILCPWFASK